MTLLWVLLALTALVFLAGFYGFVFVFVRRRQVDIHDAEAVEQSSWSPHAKRIAWALQWLETLPVELWQVVSYDGKKLVGHFIPCENAKGTLIQFHGYRSTFALDFSASMEFYHDLGYNLLLCEQRGNGLSEGKLITFGIRERMDVLSWATYAGLKLGQEHPIFLSGLSMGATSVLMASDMEFPANVRGLLADCGFTSPGDIIRHLLKERYRLPQKLTIWLLNFYTRLLAGFTLDEWSTEKALRNAKYPVLFVHGLEDDYVPNFMTRRSYEACTSEKTLLEFPEAGHGLSYLVDMPRYQQALRTFLLKHTEG